MLPLLNNALKRFARRGAISSTINLSQQWCWRRISLRALWWTIQNRLTHLSFETGCNPASDWPRQRLLWSERLPLVLSISSQRWRIVLYKRSANASGKSCFGRSSAGEDPNMRKGSLESVNSSLLIAGMQVYDQCVLISIPKPFSLIAFFLC